MKMIGIMKFGNLEEKDLINFIDFVVHWFVNSVRV